MTKREREARFHAEAAELYERVKYTLSGPEGLGRCYEIVAERWDRNETAGKCRAAEKEKC